MARRPLHLRARYVREHKLLFLAVIAVTAAAMVAVIALLDDAVRGAVAGAVLVFGGWAAWKITDRVSYLDHGRYDKRPSSKDEAA